MTPKTNFHPETDGFGFVNDWTFEGFEQQILADTIRAAAPAAVLLLSPVVLALGAPVILPAAGLAAAVLGPFAPLALGFLAPIAAKALLEDIVNAAVSRHYGLCGGMAFSALDYYKMNWVPSGAGVPKDQQPHRSGDPNAASDKLRDYLWVRLIDSLVNDNAATCVSYTLLQSLPGGAGWLRDNSKQELQKIFKHLDAGEPWPVGLVGTTLIPFENHQVLAINYDATDPNRPTLTVYDSNGPGKPSIIKLDFTGDALTAMPDDTYTNLTDKSRGPLRAIYCETYSFKTAPVAVGISAGLTEQPQPCANVGEKVQLAFSAKNVGYGPAPNLRLKVAGLGPGIGVDGDKVALTIAENTARPLTLSPAFPTAGGRVLTAQCELPTNAKTPVSKSLPLLPGGSATTVLLNVMAPLKVSVVRHNCDAAWVEGDGATFQVDTSIFAFGGLSYQWSLTGAVADGPANGKAFRVKQLPDQASR